MNRMINSTSDIEGLLGQADNFMKNHRYEEAIETLEKSLFIDPRNKIALEHVVVCNLELKQPKKAIQALTQLIGVEPNCHRFWGDKGYLHLLLNEIPEGIGALKESLKIDSRNAYNWELLGAAYMAHDEWIYALDALLSGINLNPNSAMAWYNAAICFFMLDRYSEAVEAAEYSFSIDPMLEEMASDWIEVIQEAVLFGDSYDDVEFDDLVAG